MTDERSPGVLGSLPRTRPHRRSAKRAQAKAVPDVAETPRASAEAAAAKPAKATKATTATKATKATRATPKPSPRRQAAPAAKRAGGPSTAARKSPAPRSAAPEPAAAAHGDSEAEHGPLETALGAAAELAEIGLHASARALRGALSRLPRP